MPEALGLRQPAAAFAGRSLLRFNPQNRKGEDSYPQMAQMAQMMQMF